MRIFFVLLLIFSCSRSDETKVTDHYDGKKFFNPGNPDTNTFFDFLKWQIEGGFKDWPEWVEITEQPAPVLPEGKKANLTFINHATFLIQLPDLTIITDPMYSQRPSPVSFVGPKRVHNPGISFEALPPIDVVLISHSHYDHLDLPTLKNLDARFHPLFIVPLKNREFLIREGLQNVVELDWWKEQKVKDVMFTFTPSLHWANRTPWDKNETLWGSFMITSENLKIYFGGDTGYGDHFRETRSRLGAPDISLLPIGAYEPRWFMQKHHMNPEEAFRAHQDLGSGHSFGMHFGTFQLTNEGREEPVEALEKVREGNETFTVLKPGEGQVF